MADVLVRCGGLRALLFPSCRILSAARHLATTAGKQKGQAIVNVRSREVLSSVMNNCPSCTKLRQMSSQSAAALPSQITTAKSGELEKSPKYQQLQVMPFSLIQGGKSVAHLLLKHKPRQALVFVRAKVLAVELIKELEEYGLKCSSIEDAPDEETEDSESRITVMTEFEVDAMELLLPVDLILLVQQPMSGKSFTLYCLKKMHAKVKPLDVILLYTQNDIAFLSQMQTLVDVKKLAPPSFCNLPMVHEAEGLPALPEESAVITGRDLIEPPPPEITAPIARKPTPSKLFTPPVPVRTKQSERHRLKDRAHIYVRAGSGGQGSSMFGGVGGDGGDVIVQCFGNAHLTQFTQKENRRICAEHGTFFSRNKKKKQNTVRGRDIVIPVPPGTTVSTEDGDILGELEEVGSRLLVARGGRGGSPATENWGGEKGERRMIQLDMRLFADVALVGFPNAGKSTLLGVISRASPKAADYAFTTMRPNIGMVEYDDHSQVSVADLPGLIEGASLNRGLGHTFLKHTQKARALALVVDIDGFQLSAKYPQRTALENVCILLKELVLYDRELLDRPKILIVTKLDRKGATSRFQALQQNLHSINNPEALLPVLQQIESNGPTLQGNPQRETSLLDLADDLTAINFESIIPFSARTAFGLEDVREKIKELALTRQQLSISVQGN